MTDNLADSGAFSAPQTKHISAPEPTNKAASDLHTRVNEIMPSYADKKDVTKMTEFIEAELTKAREGSGLDKLSESSNQEETMSLTFVQELEGLINKYSQENLSDTPDFILANYLNNCLLNMAEATRARDKWYDFNPVEDSLTSLTDLATDSSDASTRHDEPPTSAQSERTKHA